MRYLLLIFIFAMGCASQPPAQDMTLDDIPPPTIEEIDQTFEQVEKPAIKKKKAKLPTNKGGKHGKKTKAPRRN